MNSLIAHAFTFYLFLATTALYVAGVAGATRHQVGRDDQMRLCAYQRKNTPREMF